MSASNWRECPRCLLEEKARREKAIAKAEKLYGKVSSEEYLKVQREASALIKLDETLREDYYIFVDEQGRFVAHYNCSCQKCFFEFSYDHEQQLDCSKPRKESQ